MANFEKQQSTSAEASIENAAVNKETKNQQSSDDAIGGLTSETGGNNLIY
jgi:hypothetical protein